MSQNEIMNLLSRKVDHIDFNSMMNSKTSKKETSMVFEQIKILHKQIESLASVIQQQVRMKLDSHNFETKNQMRNSQVKILNQILLISNWIKQFDSMRIDDVFDPENNFLSSSEFANFEN